MIETAIIGAGPYGLSIAAHFRRRGIPFRIFGRPMDSWLAHMPKGMMLKSDGFASNIYDPDAKFSLRQFCAERGIKLSAGYRAENIPADAYDLPPMPRRPRAPRPASEPPAQTAPAPQPDVEQYVFVRRDGGLVFAVAYSWDKGTLRYVTPEGLRRSIGRDALDLNATQQFNEQRGLTFQAPA